MSRIQRQTIHMLTAKLWAMRSTCKQPNRKIGCVITTSDLKQILSIGYNGPPQGLPNDSCRNISGDCGCNHAEMNAIAKVDSTIPKKTLFVTMQPCEACAGIIAQANISNVNFCDGYRNTKGLQLLQDCGISYQWLNITDYLGVEFDGLRIPQR